ncbi:MAG: cytochrome c biogenesis protein CcsA [Planctomycetales bacterium]|nr:cytochrome c biogenesis protein CcsA [Planctomycetales bacterium]
MTRPARIVPSLAAAAVAALVPALRAPAALADDALEPLRAVAVQDGGRVKPLDVFARETVRIVTGRASWRGEEPLETLLRWLAEPARTHEEPLLRVRHLELRARLALGGEEYLSARALEGNAAFWEILKAAAAKRRAEEKLDPLESRAGELHGAYARLREIVTGGAPRVVAIPHGEEGAWLTAAEVLAFSSPRGAHGSPSGPDAGLPDLEAAAPIGRAYETLLAATRAGDRAALGDAGGAFASACRAVGSSGDPPLQPPLADLRREVHYFRADPLGWALWGYLAGLALLAATTPVRSRAVALLSGAPAVLGLGLHAYGIVLRVLISGRPPVTNMYESIIWVAFGAALFGALFTAVQRVRLYLLAGSAMAWLGLSFAKASPLTLDPSISALVPVLRNNFWLSVHVPTVTLSYAAFALAMGLGHVVMGFALFRPEREETLRRLSNYVYRAMQVGVLLLAAGTILGGVWAYYSWGRFWGWDPKEVGALVALLGYLAALHGRFAGWWRDFGLAVSSVLSFQLVLVAWYGVNVLGVGLHSYGWSTGSLWILVGIAAAEGLLCLLAFARLRARPPAPPPSAAL